MLRITGGWGVLYIIILLAAGAGSRIGLDLSFDLFEE